MKWMCLLMGGVVLLTAKPARSGESAARPRLWGTIVYLAGEKATLTLGQAQGVKVGDQLFVLREGRIVGTVRLTQVGERRSQAVVVSQRSPERVRVGDTVTNRPPSFLPRHRPLPAQKGKLLGYVTRVGEACLGVTVRHPLQVGQKVHLLWPEGTGLAAEVVKVKGAQAEIKLTVPLPRGMVTVGLPVMAGPPSRPLTVSPLVPSLPVSAAETPGVQKPGFRPPNRGYLSRLRGAEAEMYLPPGHGLYPGAVLPVVRDREPVGYLRLTEVGPRRAQGVLTAAPTGRQPRAGDAVLLRPTRPPTQIVWPPREPGPASGLSLEGFTGLLTIPVAEVTPEGRIRFAYSNSIAAEADFLRGGRTEDNYAFSLGFLPGLEIGGRMTKAGLDLSANAQYCWKPKGLGQLAIAIGAQDITGTQQLKANYIVATQSWGRTQVTLGYGTDRLDGPFLGLETRISSDLHLLAEHVGHQYNLALRFRPRPSWQVNVGLLAGREFCLGFSYDLPLGFRPRPSGPLVFPPSPTLSPEEGRRHLTAALQAEGLENLRVGPASAPRWRIEYENRRFLRSELEALGRVLAAAAAYAPSSVQRIRVVVKRRDVPVLVVTVPLADYRAFLAGRLAPKTFAQRLEVDFGGKDCSRSTPSPLLNRSRGRTDVVLRPSIGVEIAEFGLLLSERLLPEVEIQGGRGLLARLRAEVPIDDDITNRRTTRLQQALLSLAYRVPTLGLGQTTAGRLSPHRYGVVTELGRLLPGGHGYAQLQVALFGDSPSEVRRLSLVAAYDYYLPRWDAYARVWVGKFREGDFGYACDLTRLFGTTEIGFFFRRTEHGRLVGMRLGLPLAPPAFAPPHRLRLRHSDYFDFSIATTLQRPNIIREDIGNLVRTGQELDRAFFDRGRLRASYLRAHVLQLKAVAESWARQRLPAALSPSAVEAY